MGERNSIVGKVFLQLLSAEELESAEIITKRIAELQSKD